MEEGGEDYLDWAWEDVAPLYGELEGRELSAGTVEGFLAGWSALAERVEELGQQLEVGTTRNTADEVLSARYRTYVEEMRPRIEEAEQALRAKLLASGLVPPGMEVPLRNMAAAARIFRPENLPLVAQESLLTERYYRITGARTVVWEGEEIPLAQLTRVQEEPERARREGAFHLSSGRRRQDDAALDEVWRELLTVRQRMAVNAGFDDYRSYRWIQLKRFDYTPEDCQAFARSVEEVVVPAVARMMERRRRQLGVAALRPWDLRVDPLNQPPLRPYRRPEELEERTSAIFRQVDPQLGEYFDVMRREGLLDLQSRKDKAPGGYCTVFPVRRRPFIFANSTGTRLDVETLLHEGGHAFHIFESAHLPYLPQRSFDHIPTEFAEVGSMAMEFLGEPFLTREAGGFYNAEDAARARLNHLRERVLLLWAQLAMGDTFQQWIYQHPAEAMDTARVSAVWRALHERFQPGVDWSGLEEELSGNWRDTLHFFQVPFYFIEYAFAQLGAVQVWSNAQRDRAEAVRRYRGALALGATRTLPDLFAAAGARFAFDRETLRQAVAQVETAISELERA